MNFLVKIIGVEHKSQSIIIDRETFFPIPSFQMLNNKIKLSDIIQTYEGKEAFIEYINKSRVDGEPIFRIDTLQIERHEKISKILK